MLQNLENIVLVELMYKEKYIFQSFYDFDNTFRLGFSFKPRLIQTIGKPFLFSYKKNTNNFSSKSAFENSNMLENIQKSNVKDYLINDKNYLGYYLGDEFKKNDEIFVPVQFYLLKEL